MAQYQFHSKPSQLLSFKEDKLRCFITGGETEKQLLRMAETVRVARIRVIRVQRSKMVPCGGEDLKAKYAELDQRIHDLMATTPEAILNEFRPRGS
jgi:hypothetical protein